MLRPMIENMQNNIRQQRSGSLNPFPSASASISQTPAPQIFESSLSDALRAGVNNIVSDVVTRTNIKAQLEERPTISAESSTLPSIVNKILQLVDESGVPGSALSEAEKTALQAVVTKIDTKSANAGFESEAYAVLNRLLLSGCSKSYHNCLFLLRLMALLDHQVAFQSVAVYATVLNKLSANDFSSVPVQCLALYTISNSGIAATWPLLCRCTVVDRPARRHHSQLYGAQPTGSASDQLYSDLQYYPRLHAERFAHRSMGLVGGSASHCCAAAMWLP